MLTFGSSFAGIGGFDLGLERAGMRCIWQSENDKKASDVLSLRFPGVPNLGDIRNVTKETAPTPNVICGGFPCQDLSVAGKRKGLAGSRSGLWFEFHRVLKEFRPQWAIVENVPGLLSSNGGRDFAVILQGLAEIGYLSAWRVLDAQYYGVAQRRRRVFIVASLGNGGAAQVLFERESLSWDSAPSREAGARVAAYACRRAQTSSNGWGIREEVTGALDSSGGDAIAFDIRNQAETGEKTHPLQAKESGGYSLNYQPVIAYGVSENQRAELKLTEYSRQITTGGGKPGQGYPAAITQFGVRRLTPTECERLQGFPDGWTDNGQSDSARYRQLGNAVWVHVAEWIGRQIIRVEMSCLR